MWKTILGLSLTVFFCLSAQAAAHRFESGDRQVSLLELYTSQGCSSCPPAERWIAGLESGSGLWSEFVPVVFHVDYWDRLGWEDPFAKPEFSKRQRAYASYLGLRSVYTPGFFYNGNEWRGFFGDRVLPENSRPAPGKLIAGVEGATVTVKYTGDPAGKTVYVAVLGFGLETDVRRGENRGRNLKGSFVVLSLKSGALDTTDATELTLDFSKEAPRYGLAVWLVNQAAPCPPIQATGGFL